MCRASLIVAAMIVAVPLAAVAADGFVIRLTETGRVEVVPYQLPRSGRDTQPGIAVWSRGGPEQWAVLPGELRIDKSAAPAALALRSATRGGAGAGSAAGPEAMTFQPEQLLGQVVTRAAGLTFITPPDQGVYLSGAFTIRRQPDDGAEKFPAATAVLRRGSKDLFPIALPAKTAEVRWDEIEDLPAEWKDGLKPGAYTLRVEKGPVTSFQVVAPEIREELLQPLDQLAKVAGEASPVYFLALTQRLSCWKDEEGEFKSFAADALDRLDDAAKKQPALATKSWLPKLRERIVRKLTADSKKSEDVAATGIEIIDQARAAIQEGAWEAALQTLAEPATEETPRSQALALIYRGVIAAESGSAAGGTPDRLFQEALARLSDGEAADKFRAHNNYGGLLFARARDQVHNHSFQAAGGVSTPLLRALDDWRGAQYHYEQALANTEKLDPSLAAGTQVNLARLYALLADLIRVLDFSADGSRKFITGETAAAIAATELAQQALAKPDEIDAVTRASAYDVLAQLAFRAEKMDVAKRRAEQSLAAYVEAESLPGAEGVARLLGLIEAREHPDVALKHLQTSQLLTEMLRERLPADRAGRSRAGFFARRAYVSERIVELLIARGDDAEALAVAEVAKARSLQDVLAQRGVATKQASHEQRGIEALLADWPEEIAAVEYFLGAEHAWGFLIDPEGKVKSWQLVDSSDQPLASRDLVRRVRTLLNDFEGQANKMFRRASAGQPFDHSWQDELHRFAEELLPKKIRDEFKAAKHVVVVPHHVLNYFPFAALVTELDPTPRGKLELPQPKFLIDEPYSMSRAPSLAAWDLLRRKEAAVAQVQAVGIVEFEQAEPLPGVEKDLANLKAAFGDKLQKSVVGDDANETNIRDVLREPGLLFVGTHGHNVAEEPLASYLLCHAQGDHDGRLTAGELFGEEVAASLVVMSACYSGLADQSPLPGDDLFGLERAFLSAGASTVVSGLWDVYDETGPTLMQSFFQNLVAGKPAAKALAGAQRDFVAARRKEGAGDPWMHPYFWAVYTVSGSELTALERSAR